MRPRSLVVLYSFCTITILNFSTRQHLVVLASELCCMRTFRLIQIKLKTVFKLFFGRSKGESTWSLVLLPIIPRGPQSPTCRRHLSHTAPHTIPMLYPHTNSPVDAEWVAQEHPHPLSIINNTHKAGVHWPSRDGMEIRSDGKWSILSGDEIV